ncbi:MAG: HD domain-containing protein [bacterium]
MQYLRAKLTRVLIEYFGGDDRRINHALNVLHHADRLTGNYPGCDPDIAIASALLHDVGIKISEERHGYNNGKTQEEYGPAVAEALLKRIGFPSDKIEIVTNIIGNHHSPSRYDYPELALLKEADLIVNKAEGLHESQAEVHGR